MRRTDWQAFVPTPKKAEEWTREMDWVIADATRAPLPSPSYSTDLEAVVRAAEKWVEKNARWISLSNDSEGKKWTASLNPNEAFIDDNECYAVAPTLALALAKALYAAIKAEVK